MASVRTTATAEGDAYRINGTAIWTTDAHRNHYTTVWFEPAATENRHAGCRADHRRLENDGAQVRPIANMAGGEDFNEVVFDNVLVPKDRVVGEPGNGWLRSPELAYERSGPDILSAYRVFVELVRICGGEPYARTVCRHRPYCFALYDAATYVDFCRRHVRAGQGCGG